MQYSKEDYKKLGFLFQKRQATLSQLDKRLEKEAKEARYEAIIQFNKGRLMAIGG
jgi:hypothetical protein